MTDPTHPAQGQTVERTWRGGLDGQLHAVLAIGGDAQSYCGRELHPAGTAAAAAGDRRHGECLMIELTRLHGVLRSGGEEP